MLAGIRLLRVALAIGLAANTMPAAYETRPVVSIVAYNQATVTDDVLDRAQTDVLEIFGAAGITVRWIAPASPEGASGRSGIRIVIRRHPVDDSTTVMGRAIGNTGETGGSAFVFYQVVLDSAHRHHQNVSRVLAYAIAHEMGHLLLSAPAHSPTGIMRGDWSGDDLRHIADNSLRFTADQAAAMQARARAAGVKSAK